MSSEHGKISTTGYNALRVTVRHMANPDIIAGIKMRGNDICTHVPIAIVSSLDSSNHRPITN